MGGGPAKCRHGPVKGAVNSSNLKGLSAPCSHKFLQSGRTAPRRPPLCPAATSDQRKQRRRAAQQRMTALELFASDVANVPGTQPLLNA